MNHRHWESTAGDMLAPMSEIPLEPQRGKRKSMSPRARMILVASGVVLVVAAIWVTVVLVQQARDQRFLDALDADTTTTIGELPDEQLLISRESYCEDISRGMSVEEVVDAAGVQPDGSDITYAQYKNNVRALYNAASVAC